MTTTNPPIQLDDESIVWFTPALNNTSGSPRDFCYVAGPMTGYPGFNYPAFDAARDALAAEGWNVISPTDLDRINIGIEFDKMEGTEDLRHLSTAFARQDIASILVSDAVFVLPGWEMSTGATNEARIATMLGLPVYTYEGRERVGLTAQFASAGVAQ
jgi:hypothetical protein